MFYSLVEMKTNLSLTSDSERKRERGAEMGGGGGKRAGGKSSHLDACLCGCHCFFFI